MHPRAGYVILILILEKLCSGVRYRTVLCHAPKQQEKGIPMKIEMCIRDRRKKYDCNMPWILLFDPTSACNLHCKGCWAAEYGNRLNLTYDCLLYTSRCV